jgi:phosphocarrier protein
MDLMMLGAGIGDEVEIEVRGPQAEEAMAAVEALIVARFFEDD